MHWPWQKYTIELYQKIKRNMFIIAHKMLIETHTNTKQLIIIFPTVVIYPCVVCTPEAFFFTYGKYRLFLFYMQEWFCRPCMMIIKAVHVLYLLLLLCRCLLANYGWALSLLCFVISDDCILLVFVASKKWMKRRLSLIESF